MIIGMQQLPPPACKGVKIYHFSSEIIFGQLLKTFGTYFLVTLVTIDDAFLVAAEPLLVSFMGVGMGVRVSCT